MTYCHSERSEESLLHETRQYVGMFRECSTQQHTEERVNPMPKELTWTDSEDIGILLSEVHPEVDPLSVRFTDLHKYVIALPSFKDDPAKSNEAKLEAIQMAWHAEVLDRTQG